MSGAGGQGIAARFAPGVCSCLVVKVGSALLVDPAGQIRAEWLGQLVADVAGRIAAGQRVVLVSSGAIALGARRLGLAGGGRNSLEDAQAAAAAGQIALSGAWAGLLAGHGLHAAQLLLTLDDLEDRRRFLNAAATLRRLLALGAVPVVNENDSVATEEIRFGDNDRLAARVGLAAGAAGVLLLSDVAGLFTANPHRDPAARLVAEVAAVDDAVRAMADAGSRSGMGTGGMMAKLRAAEIAGAAGVPLAIVAGGRAHPLAAFAADGQGTLFHPAAGTGTGARKAWLAGGLGAKGQLVADAGAVQALHAGASLLAAGLRRADGGFRRGDVVEVLDEAARPVARGLAEYDAAATRLILGLRTDAQAAVLGHAPRSAVVHRDHLVLL